TPRPIPAIPSALPGPLAAAGGFSSGTSRIEVILPPAAAGKTRILPESRLLGRRLRDGGPTPRDGAHRGVGHVFFENVLNSVPKRRERKRTCTSRHVGPAPTQS